MLADQEIPVHPNGGPLLCHMCQRQVYFSNGFLPLLIKEVIRKARWVQLQH